MCSEWLSGGVTGDLTICSIIGNFFHGNGKFLQKGKPTGPKTQGLLGKLPPFLFFGDIMSKGSKIKKQNSKSEKDSSSLGSDFSVVDGKSTCDKGMPVGAESNELLDTEAKAVAEESLIIKSTSLNARFIH